MRTDQLAPMLRRMAALPPGSTLEIRNHRGESQGEPADLAGLEAFLRA
jgi:hypothetical protein